MNDTPPPNPFVPALIVVDLQEDFCPPSGTLQVPSGRSTVPIINHLLTLPFVLKIATKDWHPPNHISFAVNHPPPNNIAFESFITIKHPDDPNREYETRLWPVHCVRDTPGAEFVSELNVSMVDWVVKKGENPGIETYSAFTDPFHEAPFVPGSKSVSTTRLAETLQEAGVTHVYVVGLATDYCVKDTALDAVRFGFKTIVVREAVRGVVPGTGERWAEEEMEWAGVNLVSSEGVEVGWVRDFQGKDVK